MAKIDQSHRLNTKSYRDTSLQIKDVPKLGEHLGGTFMQLSVTGN